MWPFRDSPLTLAETLDRRRLAERMRADWDARARSNPLHFVNTAREDWDDDDFFQTGQANVRTHVEQRLDEIRGAKSPAEMRVLDIGCGVGRLTRALAGIFGEAHGVDVSGEMVAKGREMLRDVPNAWLHQNNGLDLRCVEPPFDFAFSYIVFQHIPSRRVIEGYIRETFSVLAPGAAFVFQAAGKPRIDSRLMSLVVNLGVPNTWVGAFLSEKEIRRMADRAGFQVERVEPGDGNDLWVRLRKPGGDCE